MGKYRIVKLYMALCLAVGVFVLPANRLGVQASAAVVATVQGTVMAGTTSDLLKLSTKEGDMEIKLDSGTDTSACKILLPDYKISVSVSHGSDGYLHAVRITTEAQAPTVTLDFSTSASVAGTIGDKTTSELLYFNTPQGEMEIKLDSTTNMSGCSVLVVDRSYNIVCVRGSDAYMHAVSISDSTVPVVPTPGTTPGTVPGQVSGAGPAPSVQAPAASASVTGTVTERTEENFLFLQTNGGEMQFAIDASTDTRSGMVLTPGNKLTVAFYHGSDAYLHAVSIVGIKDNVAVPDMDKSDVATVTGTVGDDSDQNVLYLDTQQGEMQLKLDAVNSINNCKAFVSGKKLTLTCTRGSDAYMHAIDIWGN